MLTISGLVVVGGLIYAGSKVIPQAATIGLKQLPRTIRTGVSRLTSIGRRQPLVYHLEKELPIVSPALQNANRAVSFASIGLGLAAIGAITSPVLLVATIPLSLYYFWPTYHSAYRTLRDERRITTPVLDATRVTVCIVMGYLFSAALNAWLESLSQRMLIQTKENFDRTVGTHFGQKPESVWLFQDGAEVEILLEELQPGAVVGVATGEMIPADGIVLYGAAWVDERMTNGSEIPVWKETGSQISAETTVQQGQIFIEIYDPPTLDTVANIRNTLQQSASNWTFAQQLGERSGDSMAPFSLLAFFLTLPVWGANRAAAFLTTSFGIQMRTLGPYLRHNFVDLAARQQILVRDARGLEMANLVNTIIINAETVVDPAHHKDIKEMLYQLRQHPWPMKQTSSQPFAIYLLATGAKTGTKAQEVQALAAELGFDDYFVEPLSLQKAALIERLQSSGRFVCYVGNGVEEAIVMEKAFVTVSCQGASTITKDTAQIVLLTPHPGKLDRLFVLATQFAAKEGSSILWPFVMDIVDISTTVFMHLGLVYSLLMNYSGFFASAISGRAPLSRHMGKRPGEDTSSDFDPIEKQISGSF
ncbi:MAG: hypothetical protein AAF702_31570 [Chloroflexota bacterium]